VACLAFMIAYVDPDLRTSLGWLALPLLLYVIAWEGWGAVRAAATESDAASDGVGADLLGWVGGFWRLLYRILLVVPPAGAGAFLVFALLYPGAWIFPSMPAPLRCTPETVARGDTVTLRLTGPHGGELGVLTPAAPTGPRPSAAVRPTGTVPARGAARRRGSPSLRRRGGAGGSAPRRAGIGAPETRRCSRSGPTGLGSGRRDRRLDRRTAVPG